MKKLMIIMFLTALFSCERDAEFCWECQVTEVTVSQGATTTLSGPQTKCNMTQYEINAFERGTTKGNTTSTATCVMQ